MPGPIIFYAPVEDTLAYGTAARGEIIFYSVVEDCSFREEPLVQHLISQYGYLAVFVLMLAESACVPVPSEVIMMFGGALAAGAVAGVSDDGAGGTPPGGPLMMFLAGVPTGGAVSLMCS